MMYTTTLILFDQRPPGREVFFCSLFIHSVSCALSALFLARFDQLFRKTPYQRSKPCTMRCFINDSHEKKNLHSKMKSCFGFVVVFFMFFFSSLSLSIDVCFFVSQAQRER